MSKPLKKLLQGVLPDHLLPFLVGAYDVVGDIAVIIIPDELLEFEKLIGQTLLDNHPDLAVVVKRAGIHDGEYRVLPVEVIAGENRTITEVRESGVRLQLDLQKVYYSVRSGGERIRVARLVQPGERVLVAFSGIAPYPLVLSRLSEATEIVGVEKNKSAHSFACRNVKLNKRLKNIRLYHDDILRWLAREDEIFCKFDRIIMPLPKNGERFLAPLLGKLVAGGWLHFYDMQQSAEFDKTAEFVEVVGAGHGRRLQEHSVVRCGHCGPGTYRICVDAKFL